MSRGTYDDFLAAIRERESRNRYTIVNKYGFLGAYQMGEEALIDAGFYMPDGTKKNDWKGTWTSKAQNMGINSKADFLGAKISKVKVEGKEVEKIEQDTAKIKNARKAQDEAVKAYYQKVWGYICHKQLDVDYVGKPIKGVEITESALIAAYHLVGLGTRDENSTKSKGLLLYLKTGGKIDPTDANKTPVSKYISAFNDYEVPFKARNSLKSPKASGDDRRKGNTHSKSIPQGVVPPRTIPRSIENRWIIYRT